MSSYNTTWHRVSFKVLDILFLFKQFLFILLLQNTFQQHQPNTAQQDIRRGTNPHMKAGQGNSAGGKLAPKQATELETSPGLLLGVPQKSQAKNYSIYTENQAQTHAGSTIAASVDSRFVDSPRSSTPLAPIIPLVALRTPRW